MTSDDTNTTNSLLGNNRKPTSRHVENGSEDALEVEETIPKDAGNVYKDALVEPLTKAGNEYKDELMESPPEDAGSESRRTDEDGLVLLEPVPKERSFVEELRSKEKHPKPHDGGYGWVIVAASFIIQMIGTGCVVSFGVLYVDLQEYYGVGAGMVAWIGAICIGLALGAGPLSSVMAHVLGHRLSCMIGAAVASVGLFVSAFSPNIYFLYITYGVVTGVGISLTYVPAVVMVGFYFERRRPLACGLALAGNGVGSLIFPLLIQVLIQNYTWRGTMVILSGLCLNSVVGGALLKPLPLKKDDEADFKLISHISLFKNPYFILMSLGDLLWNASSFVLLTIAVHHSTLQGVTMEKAAWLISIIGVAGTLGRLIFVVVPQHWDKLVMMTAATYMSVVPMMLYPVLPVYWSHSVQCAVYGLCFGVQLAMQPLVMVELFGLKRLTSAYGYLMLADGIGAMLGTFLGGQLYDVTRDYTSSFIVAAVFSVVASLLMTAILVKRLCNRLLLGRSSQTLKPEKVEKMEIPETAF